MEEDTTTTTKLTREMIVEAITKYPGLTTGELAALLEVDSSNMSARIYQLLAIPDSPIRRIGHSGVNRIYPIGFDDELSGHKSKRVALGGIPVEIHKLTPQESAQYIKRPSSNFRSKYAELFAHIDDLAIGESIAIPRHAINQDTLRNNLRLYYKAKGETGTFHNVSHSNAYIYVMRTK